MKQVVEERVEGGGDLNGEEMKQGSQRGGRWRGGEAALMTTLKDSECTRYERARKSVQNKVHSLEDRQMKGAPTRKRRGQKSRAGTGAPARKKKKGA